MAPIEDTDAHGSGSASDKSPAVAPPEEWTSAVREVLDHVADTRGRAGVAKEGQAWRPVAFVILALVFFGVGAWNVLSYQSAQEPAFAQERVAEGVRAAMFLTILDLEEYRAENGEYPVSLETAGFAHPDMAFRRTGEGYVLEGHTLTFPIIYTSGEDLSPFELALDTVLLTGSEEA